MARKKTITNQGEANATENNGKRLYLDKHAVKGGKSSQTLLLDWITTEGNYERWKGGSKQNGWSLILSLIF